MARGKKPDTIVNELKNACDDMANKDSRVSYQRGARTFAYFVRAEYGINYVYKLPASHDQRVDLMRAFVENMKARGLSPHTIHTYLAGACHAVGRVTSDRISQAEVDKPRRVAVTKGRNPQKNRQGHMEALKEKNARLMEIAGAIGIRRDEYRQLDGRSYRPDESGYMCVWVKGKGGKVQAQRLLPWSEAVAVKTFADVRGKERVFDKRDMNNKIDLHAVRREVARRAYDYYHHRLKTEPGYRDQLRRELIDRYDAMHPHGHKDEETTRERYLRELYGYSGVYTCRGENASELRKQGRDVSFDRLALMAVSVFHNSHWRADVTVKNYMI